LSTRTECPREELEQFRVLLRSTAARDVAVRTHHRNLRKAPFRYDADGDFRVIPHRRDGPGLEVSRDEETKRGVRVPQATAALRD
jgi:hypothetical protein